MGISTVVDLSGAQPLALVNDLLASNSGIQVDAASIQIQASGPGAVNTYDAATGAGLGIGAGVLLTSGATPGTTNSLTWFGSDNSGSTGFNNGDPAIDAVVNTVFQTQSYDATTLAFAFNVTDPAATSISFDLVFGSEEYPEWVDAFVDCAVVMVDGVNYALFNKDPLAPLSVISPNLAAGYFQDNASGILPIEYDGVSGLLRIVAPLAAGSGPHTISIGIADTGDHILDSGLFIANMRAGTDPGSGVVSNPGGGTAGNDTCTGSSKDEYFDLQAGDDVVYAGGGADIVVAGTGNDKVYAGSGSDELKGDAGDDLLDGGSDGGGSADLSIDTAVYAAVHTACSATIAADGHWILNASAAGEGIDDLIGIEQIQFSDGLFQLDGNGQFIALTLPPPPPPPFNQAGAVQITDGAGVPVNGSAAVGVSLSAQVSDPEGCSGPITYQWLLDGALLDGATAGSYQVQASQIGHVLSVAVSYNDDQGHPESHSSQSLLVLPDQGDLLLTLMSVEGPPSAGVNTPITTLLLRAVELGETPNMALQSLRAALGISDAIGSLLSTNAFAILQNPQSTAAQQDAALALAKLEAQVAICCSLANDQSGAKLTQVLLDRAANGQTFDLASATDLGTIPGLDAAALDVIVRRNTNIQNAVQLLGGGDAIENEWLDFISNWDLTLSQLPLSTLSHAINQGPTGVPSADLPHLQAGQSGYSLSEAQLIAGLHDPDGDALTVSALTSDHGDWFIQAADGSWVLDLAASTYDPTYIGPLELSYSVSDGHGHSLAVSQLLVVDHANHTPGGAVTLSVAAGGAIAQYATLQAANSLTDLDQIATPITYAWYAGTTLVAQGSSLQLTQAQVGQSIRLEASYTDGFGTLETVSSAETGAVANVEDAPTGGVSVTAGSPPKTGDTVSATNTVADLDGIPLSGAAALHYQWQSSADGLSWVDVAGATSASLTLDAALVGRMLRAQVRYTDLFGTVYGSTNAVTSAATAAVIGAGITWTGTTANDTKSGTAWDDTLNGLGGADKLSGLAGNDWLDGGSGIDTLVGGAGNDTLVVDNASDLITELAGEGMDTARASVTYSLLSKGANVEALVLTGTGAINGTGNALANTLLGNSGANLLDGGAANDTLTGGLGVDTLVGGAGADLLTGGSGTSPDGVSDTFRLVALADSLLAGFDRITDLKIAPAGTAGADSIDGPTALSAAQVKDNVGTAADLTQAALQAVLTTTTFVASGAATFTLGSGASQRTFLALNDKTAGYSSSTDAILEITGYSGALTDLAVI